nr:MAG TPA: hypothetical protein [Caudoviricetes sp.]
MITSLTATAAALAVGLPILALGELLREREERSSRPQNTSPTRKDVS